MQPDPALFEAGGTIGIRIGILEPRRVSRSKFRIGISSATDHRPPAALTPQLTCEDRPQNVHGVTFDDIWAHLELGWPSAPLHFKCRFRHFFVAKCKEINLAKFWSYDHGLHLNI